MSKKILFVIAVLLPTIFLTQCGLFEPDEKTPTEKAPFVSLTNLTPSTNSIYVEAEIEMPTPCYSYTGRMVWGDFRWESSMLPKYFVYPTIKPTPDKICPQVIVVLPISFSLEFETGGAKILHFWSGFNSSGDSTFIDTVVVIP